VEGLVVVDVEVETMGNAVKACRLRLAGLTIRPLSLPLTRTSEANLTSYSISIPSQAGQILPLYRYVSAILHSKVCFLQKSAEITEHFSCPFTPNKCPALTWDLENG
jgi:hypothetical protein